MPKETRRLLFQIALFVITFITTTIAGNEWAYGRNIFFTPDYGWHDFINGLSFSIPLLAILTVHEFGHYFVAMYHKVKTSLPYYIPIPPIPFLPFSIGTMGAVIRLRSKPYSNLQNFDIGLAGPLAGFILAVIIMIYGFVTLPPAEYVFQFHPEYKQYGTNYAATVYTEEFKQMQIKQMRDELRKLNQSTNGENDSTVNAEAEGTENAVGIIDVQIGNNLAFMMLGKIFADPERMPNSHELMHYPVLLACYIALFVTCLNLLPIGQLDGGHVMYGLFGFKTHRIIATVFFLALMFYAGLGLSYIDPHIAKGENLLLGIVGYVLFLYFSFRGLGLPTRDTWMYALLMAAIQFLLMYFVKGIQGYQGWLLFGFLLGRVIGVQHPRSEVELPLDSKRIVLGWITLLIFVLCFSPAPIVIE